MKIVIWILTLFESFIYGFARIFIRRRRTYKTGDDIKIGATVKNGYRSETVLTNSFVCTIRPQLFEAGGFIVFRQDRQYIALEHKEKFLIDYESDEGGLTTTRSEPIVVNIELIDENGDVAEFEFSGAFGNNKSKYSSVQKLDNNKNYRQLKISSTPDLEIENILWGTYNIRDMK